MFKVLVAFDADESLKIGSAALTGGTAVNAKAAGAGAVAVAGSPGARSSGSDTGGVVGREASIASAWLGSALASAGAVDIAVGFEEAGRAGAAPETATGPKTIASRRMNVSC